MEALWTTPSPDPLKSEIPNSAETQGSKTHMSVAGGIANWLSLSEEKTGSVSPEILNCVSPEILNCLSLWTYWCYFGKYLARKLHLLLPPCSKKRHLQKFSKQINETTYISLKGLGHLNTKE